MGCGQSTVVPHPTETKPNHKVSETGATPAAASPPTPPAPAAERSSKQAAASEDTPVPPPSAGANSAFGSVLSTETPPVTTERCSPNASATRPASGMSAAAPAAEQSTGPAGELVIGGDLPMPKVEGSGTLPGEGWTETDAGGAAAAAATAAAIAAGQAAIVAAVASGNSPAAAAAAAASDATLLASLPPVASKGISMKGLRKLWGRVRSLYESGAFSNAVEVVEDGGGKWKLEGVDSVDAVTPAHLVHMWIRKEAGQGSLADGREVVEASELGRPTFYLSHTWNGSVRLLVETAEAYMGSSGDQARVWIDWVAVRQNSGPGRDEDLAAVGQVMRACSGGTIVVSDPRANNPNSRMWCLYEWGQTLALHGSDALHVASLGHEDLEELVGGLGSGTMVAAQCRLAADRERLRGMLVKAYSGEQQCGEDLRLQVLLRPLALAPELQHLVLRGGAETWSKSLAPAQQWVGQQLGTRWTSRALCILGGEGTGKSCAAAAICTHLLGLQAVPPTSEGHPPGLWQWQAAQGGPPCAALFLKQGDLRTLDPIRMVKSIAYQLALRLPSLRSHLLSLKPSDIATISSMETAFALLMGPVAMMHDHIMILIDGIDEAEPQEGPIKGAMARGNTALSLLLSCLVTRLPANVRFILTSRPEAAMGGIRDALQRTSLPNIAFMEPWQLRVADQDAAAAAAAPGEGGGLVGAEAAPVAPAGANRVMLFDALVKDCGLQLPSPRTPDLDSVYWAFSSAFGSDKVKVTDKTVELLQVLVAAQEPLPETMLHTMGFSEALAALPGWGHLFVSIDSKVGFVHRTLAAWLAGASAPEAGKGSNSSVPRWLAVDVAAGHAALGRYLLRHVLKAGGAVGGDEGGAGAAAAAGKAEDADWQDDGAGLMALVPDYAAKYTVLHLCRATTGDPSCAPLLDSALAQWEFLRQAFKGGFGATLLTALGSLIGRSKYCEDAFKWMRLCFKEFQAAPEDMEAITLRDCPYSACIKYREAAHRLKAWFTALAFGGSHAGDWPADLAVLKGHTNAVVSVAFSPNGKQIATGGDDFTARVWDMATTQCLVVLEGHTAPVVTVAFSPDGKWLATGSADSSASLWDMVSGQCTAKMMHGSTVYSVAFRPDGKFLATGSGDQTVGIWDLSRTVGFGHANQHTAALLQNDMGQVYSVAFSSDNNMLIAGCGNSIRLFDAQTWAMTHVILLNLQSGSDKVPSIAFHPDCKHIATGLLGTARVYELISSRCVASVETRGEVEGALTSDATVAAYASVALNHTGRYIAVAAENLMHATRVWDWGTGQCVAELAKTRVRSVAFSPDSLQLVTGNANNSVRIWDLSSRQCLPSAKSTYNIGNSFVVSPDGTKLASILIDKSKGRSIVYLWDLISWQCIAMFEGHNVLHPGPTGKFLEAAFSPNSRLVCTYAAKDSTAWVWDLATRKCVAMLQGHNRGVTSVTFSSDNKYLVTGSRGNTAKVWEIAGGQCLINVEGFLDAVPEDGIMTAYPNLEGADAGEVYSIAYSTDKRLLALGGHFQARVVDCATRKCLAVLKSSNMAPVTCIAFSPDATSVATGSKFEQTARVWDALSGQCTAELKGHRLSSCHSITFSPDGSKVVTGLGANSSKIGEAQPDGTVLTAASFDSAAVNTARVWDVSTGLWPACVAVLEGHTAEVISVTYSPDGRRLTTGGRDQTGRVWEMADGHMMERAVVNQKLFKMQSVRRLQS